MYINKEVAIKKNRMTKTLVIEWKGKDTTTVAPSEISIVYHSLRGMSPELKDTKFKEILHSGCCPTMAALLNEEEKHIIKEYADKASAIQAIDNLVNFFSEFQFFPSFRFLNTLRCTLDKSVDNAIEYVGNYFKLMDSPYVNEVTEKVKSIEFNNILDTISRVESTQTINNRLKVYYGCQGGGKTTAGERECDGRTIVCNSSMLPADLLEDFTFNDGKAAFKPSILVECMENGLPIMLDEFNLLPFDTMRFLQGITDGKEYFYHKGVKINIKKGFTIIGTMNLTIGGVNYGLPEPLVDRCGEIKHFVPTAEMLFGAF